MLPTVRLQPCILTQNMYEHKNVLEDQELTGGHSQYVLRHFQENERPSYL